MMNIGMSKEAKRIIKWIMRAVVIAIVGFFLSRIVVKNWHQLSKFEFRFSIWYMAASLAFLCAGLFVVSYVWKIILSSLGEKIGVSEAFAVWAKSEMVKYVPGMVWTFASRAILAKKDKLLTLMSMVIEVALKVAASLLISFLLMFGYFKNIFNIYTVCALVVLGFFSLHTKVFNFIMKVGCKLIKRQWKYVHTSYWRILLWLLLLMGSWALIGIGFALVTYSVTGVSYSIPFLIGAFSLAWSAGFLFFSMPGGIGVRESVIVLLLKPIMPEAVAVVVSLVSRIWWTIGDLIVLAAAQLMLRKGKGLFSVKSEGKGK